MAEVIGLRRRLFPAVLAVCVVALACGQAAAQAVLGDPPRYTDRAPGVRGGTLPARDAIVGMIWVPGLDAGFVPQGLTVIDGVIYVAGYTPTDAAAVRGPCRVWRIDPGTGRASDPLDLPPLCGHAGGLAKGAPGRLWVVDTRVMYEVELTARDPRRLGRFIRSIALQAPLKGSFAAGDGKALWLGSYDAKGPGRLDRVALARLHGTQISAADISATLPLPSKAQGAAFDSAGRLWVSRSGARLGQFVRIELGTGAVAAAYDTPSGIEDLSFDPDGFIWTVSEAGSRRWSAWDTHFPVVFRVDPGRLGEAPLR